MLEPISASTSAEIFRGLVNEGISALLRNAASYLNVKNIILLSQGSNAVNVWRAANSELPGFTADNSAITDEYKGLHDFDLLCQKFNSLLAASYLESLFCVESFPVTGIDERVAGYIYYIYDSNVIQSAKLQHATDYITGQLQSLLASYKMSDKMASSNLFLAHLLDCMPNMLTVIDKETSSIIYQNKMALDYYGDLFGTPYVSDHLSSHEYYNRRIKKWLSYTIYDICRIDGHDTAIKIETDISREKEKDEKIQYLQWFDPIANLPNRSSFARDMEKILSKTDSYGSIVIMSIDSLVYIRDAYGSETSDFLIAAVADFLRALPELSNYLYYFGAGDFVFIVESVDEIRGIMSEVRNRFNQIWIILGNEFFCNISIGVALYPKNGNDSDVLIKNADIAKNTARQKGVNNLIYFKKNEDKKIIQRLRKEKMMRQSIISDCVDFFTYYQPIIEVHTGKWTGAEALARWIPESDGMISPAEFIPMAENLGLLNEMGHHILAQSCSDCKNWQQMPGFEDISVSVNLSISQIYEKNIAQKIYDILIQTGLEPKYLTIEITESIAMKDLRKTILCLNEIRKIGVSISLDDFGTGYSSLSNLKMLPLDHVKIDRMFISDMHKSDYHFTFTKTIIELAHSINLKTFCEGVEFNDQWEVLKRLDCDYMQGYLFCKAVTEQEFVKRLLSV